MLAERVFYGPFSPARRKTIAGSRLGEPQLFQDKYGKSKDGDFSASQLFLISF